MQERDRNRWIIVAIVGALVVVCCCLAIAGAVVISRLADFPFGTAWGPGVEGGEIDRSYDVGPSPELSIDSFAGKITVRAGDGNEIRVMATRHAPRTRNMEQIEVDIEARAGGLSIVTRNPDRLSSSWVRLEVVAPAGTSFTLHTGSGNLAISGLEGGGKAETGSGNVTARNLSGMVALHTSSGNVSVNAFEGSLTLHVSSGRILVEGMEGDLAAHTSSGRIIVREAQGRVQLDTSSGNIDYRGTPAGDCSFGTGSGNIDVRLPSDANAWVDLHAGSGSIKVSYDLEGEERDRRSVRGIIGDGSGEDLSISAQTGSGDIYVGPD